MRFSVVNVNNVDCGQLGAVGRLVGVMSASQDQCDRRFVVGRSFLVFEEESRACASCSVETLSAVRRRNAPPYMAWHGIRLCIRLHFFFSGLC